MTTAGRRARTTRPGLHLDAAGLLLAAALLLALTGGCGERREPAAEPAREALTLATVVVEPVRVERETVTSGSVHPRARVSPGSKIMGRVERVLVDEGDVVRAGQLLVGLEKADLAAAVRQAEAALKMAEAQLENARAQEARFGALHERGSITTRNLEDAVAALRIAEAGVEQAGANLDAARVAVGYAEIRAPVAGHVVETLVEAGDMTRPGSPLLTLDDLARVRVALDVPESEAVGIAPGDPVTIVVDALGLTTETVVDRVVPAGDPGSRTFRIEAALDNPGRLLRAGMFATGRFPRGEVDVLLVPPQSVVRRGQLDAVFAVDDSGIARLTWVRLGREREGGFEVLSGLDAGARIVSAPPQGLADGTPVQEK